MRSIRKKVLQQGGPDRLDGNRLFARPPDPVQKKIFDLPKMFRFLFVRVYATKNINVYCHIQLR